MATRITGEKKRKINALDFLLIILIAAVITITVVTIIQGDPKNSALGDKNISYSLTLPMISKTIVDNINVGDTIYDCDSNQNLGTIETVEIIPINATINTQNGESSKIELSDKVTVKLVVKTSVFENNNSYSIGSYRLIVGNNVSFKSEKYILSGKCTAISL